MKQVEKAKNIIVCCSAGMSSSILVKQLRKVSKQRNLEYKFLAIDSRKLALFIDRADYILIAPQVAFDYEHIKTMAQPLGVKVSVINERDYGNIDAHKVLDGLLYLEHKEEEIKMNKLSTSLEKYLLPLASKLGSNRILKIIRAGMSTTTALLILGSMSILLTNFPHEGIANFLAPSNAFFNTIYAFTSGMMGLITTVSIAYYASIEYGTVPITSVLTALSAFLISQATIVSGWPELNVSGLGVSGLMTGIIISIVSVRILLLFQEKKIAIKMPEGVPEAISESFMSLVPAVLILTLVTLITVVLGFNLNEMIMTLLTPLSRFLNTLPGYVVYHLLCATVFFLGINSAVVIGVFQVFLTSNSLANEAAYAAGETVKFVATNSVDTMIWAGGTGATIGLVLLMAFTAKSKMFRTLGKISLGPGIFNINEPIIFGTPIAFNPLLLVPFVLTPGLIAGLTHVLMTSGIISMPIIGNVPWTIPPVFVAYAMSGGDISTTLWGLLIVIISLAIYYPFFRIIDKRQYAEELKNSNLSENL